MLFSADRHAPHASGIVPAYLRPSGDLLHNTPSAPGVVLFYAAQDPDSQTDSATAGEIETALRGVQTSANTGPSVWTMGFGNWIGPRARITRVTHLGLTGGRNVYVAWAFQFPDNSTDDAAGATRDQTRINLLLTQAQARLQSIPGAHGQNWSGFALLPYDPVANGPISWWQNGGPGGAGDTRTRDAYDLNQQLGQTSSIENPTGPPHALPRDLTVPEIVASPLRGAARLITTVAIVAGVGVAGWYAWPVITGTRKAL